MNASRALRILTLVLVALVAALAVGCGGDDDEDEAATEPKQTTATEPTAVGTTVDMDEYLFDPDSLTVSRGDTLTVRNVGAIAHNLTIEKGPDPKEKSQELAGTSTFAPDKNEELTVDMRPGEYAMVCTVAGHRELGMTGKITVK